MGKIAFVFPGQGAQAPGMGASIRDLPAAKQVFTMADRLRPGTSALCFDGSIEALSETKNTQPCLFAVSLALTRCLIALGMRPDGVAGFSLGEVIGLSVSGMMSDEAGFSFVCQRADLMQACAEKTKGSMAAVMRLDASALEVLLTPYESVYTVNFNCPGQTTVAGDEAQLDALIKDIAAQKGTAIKLRVSGAFHSPFMDEASDALRDVLADMSLAPPSIPLYANATALPLTEGDKEQIALQVKQPVLWQKTIENMVTDGFDTFVELGPKKTLSGLIAKTNASVKTLHVTDLDSLYAAKAELFGGEA